MFIVTFYVPSPTALEFFFFEKQSENVSITFLKLFCAPVDKTSQD